MRRRNNNPAAENFSGAGAGGLKSRKKSRKNLTVPKTVAQCQNPILSIQHYPNTLPKTSPTLKHRDKDPSRISEAIAYLNT